MANFELDEETKRKQAEAQAQQDAIRKQQQGRDYALAGSGAPTPDELMKHNDAEFSKWQAESDLQAKRGGVETADAVSNAGGVAGFFGGKEKTTHFTAGKMEDTTTAANKAKLDALSASIAGRSDVQMSGAQLDAAQANEVRARQLGLADSLALSAAGGGPSAARAALTAGSDQAMADAMSVARSGRGSPGMALKQALMAQGKIGAQTANAAAQIGAQEQQAARVQLADVLNASRGQDLGAATTNAQLAQQTSAANMQAAIDQQKQKDAMISGLMAQGFSLDQAQRQFELQQSQFNAELLARQAAADKGIAMQSSAAGGQMVGQAAQAIGTAIAGAATMASDKRVKKNVDDGEEATRRFLRSLKPKAFEYDDEHKQFGKGRHVGVMAQDVERGTPDIVIDDTDGVKKLDMRKALSASLASLGSIDRRLAKLEARRG